MTAAAADGKWDGYCAVCGKSVADHEGFSHLKVEGEMIALCCPLCFDTFNENPAKYMRRRALRKEAGDIPPASFAALDE